MIRTKVVSGICPPAQIRIIVPEVFPLCFRRLDEITYSVMVNTDIPAAHCSMGEPFNPAHPWVWVEQCRL